jgi:hypothetical protein
MTSIIDDFHLMAGACDQIRAAIKVIQEDSDDRIVLMFPGVSRLAGDDMKQLRAILEATFPPAIAKRVVILHAAILSGAEAVEVHGG